MFKKRFEIYYVVGSKIADWIEKIFRRKELLKYKTSAGLLEKERDILEGTNKFLTTGGSVSLTREEKGMLINALEHDPFKAIIELPATKAQTRITWRDLRKKLKLHFINKVDDEIKEDDETKAGDNG